MTGKKIAYNEMQRLKRNEKEDKKGYLRVGDIPFNSVFHSNNGRITTAHVTVKQIYFASQRPDAPHGNTNPVFVTGSPISCDSTVPFHGFNSVLSMYVSTAGARPVV